MNAHGRHIPPFVIFPRKKMNDHLLLGSPPGTVGVLTYSGRTDSGWTDSGWTDSGWTDSGWTDSGWTDSGWTDSTVFIKWLKHFVYHVKPTPSKKVVLFVDGHVSHKSYEAIEYARANGIEMISFPPHTMHKLQPLNKIYFGPLKQYYGKACDRWMVNHPRKRTCFYYIAALFGEAFAKVSTLNKGVAGYSSCRLWPFNPYVLTEADFAPSMMTDDGNEHIASTSDATSPASPTTRAKLPQAVASTCYATSPASPTTRAKLPQAVTFTSDATSAPSNATACVTSLKAYVLSVFPLLKAEPRVGKRRTQSSELLTTSPYKHLLRSKQIKLSEKTKSRAGGMSVKKSDRRELHKGKRAPANEKARQPLADRPRKRPGSGRTASVYRCIYCND